MLCVDIPVMLPTLYVLCVECLEVIHVHVCGVLIDAAERSAGCLQVRKRSDYFWLLLTGDTNLFTCILCRVVCPWFLPL